MNWQIYISSMEVHYTIELKIKHKGCESLPQISLETYLKLSQLSSIIKSYFVIQVWSKKFPHLTKLVKLKNISFDFMIVFVY